ncbi:magnesium/cobalt transporter CorA [Paeniglutamicibacter psychrophenolicus]|uniref:Magnesium transport protein CorA n=1 Tax=Paeniglutamicibacter psychrophenolicus TaxID=257454 RepID=A0ABS4W860_9MICC|nr:magnesium/cobalt transporter CorA [Paeniglutamicibacter psychrophenolicus]MBP2372370.1 magnesium transporter [Paeniglutamicibacter psychrophenolicus]
MPIIDNAIYVSGKRVIHPPDLSSTFESMKECGGMAWLGLYRPDMAEMQEVAAELGLHELAVEDTLSGHQRPKLEHYGDHLFVVLRPARYIDESEKVEFGELHVYVGVDFVVTVRHAESPKLAQVRQRLEDEPGLLGIGPAAVLYAVLDQVVDEYEPVFAGLSNDIDEIEDQLFSGTSHVSRRIYELSREVIDFQRALAPLDDVLARLRRDFRLSDISEEDALELDRKLIDVQDHAIRLTERITSFRALLSNALSLSSTLASQRATEAGLAQNEQMKKISSWAAIIFAPSLVTGIYGMNFKHMPELEFSFGYPAAIGLMLALAVSLFAIFKKNNWL